MYWYREGHLHREDGPAIEYFTGTKYWFEDGLLHREDGPAIEWSDGFKTWSIKGKQVCEGDYKQWLAKKELNIKLSVNLEECPFEKRTKI